MLTYSVYVGRCSKGLAERIASLLSKVLSEGDRATIMLLNDFQYEVLMEVTKKSISVRREENTVIVFFGKGKRAKNSTSSNENTR